jgi:uncharacterized RDD family membrane protein YckC
MSYDLLNTSRLGQYAGFVTRLIAWIIDQLVVAGFTFISGWIASFVLDTLPFDNQVYELTVALILVIVNFAFLLFYFIGLWMISGQTLGKSIMGLRIVRADGERLKLRNAILRFIGYPISGMLLFLGYLMVLVDRRRQALHDKIGGTIVVYSETSEEKARNEEMLRRYIKRRGATSQEIG